MSFFGLETHNQAAPGFSQAHNPFAGLSDRDNEADALEFEDTYDGLGDQLDETDDAFNDDTFGGEDVGHGSSAPVGKDFDFFGQTAKVADAIEEEQLRFNRQAPTKVASATAQASAAAPSYTYFQEEPAYRPVRTGYEKYKEEPVEELQFDAALWGVAPKKQSTPAAPSPSQPAPPARKILSLEEVEAQMRAQAKKPVQPAAPSPVPQVQPSTQPAAQQAQYDPNYRFPRAQPAPSQYAQAPVAPSPDTTSRAKDLSQHQTQGHPVTILQRPQSKPTAPSHVPPPPPQPVVQHRQQHSISAQPAQPAQPIQPTHILQNPNRHSADATRMNVPLQPTSPMQAAHPTQPVHRQQSSFSRQPHIITHPAQLAQLSEEEKAAYLDQEAKRAKRNYKIYLMSRDNGIMTPQDKNFVTRIQLQQLVAATGNPNEHGTDESLVEDFYYQVHNQIQGGYRQHSSQPLNNFAQTYLFQTGSRQGGMRRHNRGPDNHMQRMEQQVQRAVEAAKNKPKNKQLVIEGSLGKISFSNAKTPKPLLNIKRNDSAAEVHRPGSAPKASHPATGRDPKAELRSIENVYTALMKMEDNERNMPPPPASEEDAEAYQNFMVWREESASLNAELWEALRVHDHPDQDNVHPFIAFLSYNKGMKSMRRIFRLISREQRTTILTLIVVNLDILEVVRDAQVNTGINNLNAAMRENIELFSLNVMSTLFTFMNDLELDLIGGILGLVCTRNIDIIARSRIGTSMLTMILSRAEIIKHSGGGSEQTWRAWDATYTQFFNQLEPTLPHIFPGTVSSGEDIYVWQLLAAIGIGASPDQQQRLVLAVKDRVMDTVALSKTLPAEMGQRRLQNVNLFMRSIGLDVELLQ